MNVLHIRLSEPNENGMRMAIVEIDGRELMDLVREVELPLTAKSGDAGLAGKYDYLNAQDVIFPSRHLLGEPFRPLLEYDGDPSVLECECGCEGCWPLVMTVDADDDRVVWRNFRQPHRPEWEYPAEFAFTFDRRQFDSAILLDV